MVNGQVDKDIESPIWRQHYPTYKFENTEIALEEFRSASKIMEERERLFIQAANLSIAIGTIVGSLAVGFLDRIESFLSNGISKLAALSVLLLILLIFSIIIIRYFADRQKAITFSSRKVIVLRRLLGMSYGPLQLVLPNWRIEGADEPFSIKMFPGWNTYVAYPFYVVAVISTSVLFFLLTSIIDETNKILIVDIYRNNWIFYAICGILIFWFSGIRRTYRKALLDTHESMSLLRAHFIARLLNLSLLKNTENIIYRAKLSCYELHRLKISLKEINRILIYIEDKEFRQHNGVSIKGILRMILSFLGRGPRSGGSTITQQIVRTLFIVDYKKKVRRKILEILLAMWFDRTISKDSQLEMYLASVRYEKGVYGLISAMEKFFGEIKRDLSIAESFFLIERVSNINSLILADKIAQTIKLAINDNIISQKDVSNIMNLYQTAINNKLIIDRNNSFLKLKESIKLS